MEIYFWNGKLESKGNVLDERIFLSGKVIFLCKSPR